VVTQLTRREFVKATATVAVAASASRAMGANGRLGVAFIGVGNRGGQLLQATLPNTDVDVVALCDVHRPTAEKWQAKLEGKPAIHNDFREVLARTDVDAVFVATPDHWHAIQTIYACEAGKDVYVEKPLSVTIVEGRKMVEAARRTKRVVQVGTHRRSSKAYPQLQQIIRDGAIGKVTVARCYRITNMFPSGIGKPPDSAPPEGLDWDMWLGPRPKRPYNSAITPYRFRWWQAYSSQIANWGVHYFDAIRWVLDEEAPASVSAHGGRFAVDDLRDIPDTMEAVFEFGSGRLLIFGQYEASGNPAMKSGEIEFRGTLGTVYTSEQSFEIIPERAGQFGDPKPLAEARVVSAKDGDLTRAHIRNFLDCVKSRETPLADVEIGHRSTTIALLGNIALATKARLEWDATAERVTNNDAANRLLHYTYRKPWRI
jgi:predicted dehydrogenase